MTALAALVIAVPGAVLAGFGLYLFTLAAAGVRQRPEANPAPLAPSKRLTILVPAHNEESLVGRCVLSLLSQAYPSDLVRTVVVADNCSDATEFNARAAGADVMVRLQPDTRGKGYALRWAMDRVLATADPPDAIVVVDADSVADERLLSALAAELEAGHEVVQADYTLMDERGAGTSDVAKAGFLLFHRVRFSGRARLGMAANLVGNGMLFARRVLEAHPWDAFIGAEDLEYSIRLRLAGIRPRFAPAAHVSGPGPASRTGALNQRLRWEGGRFFIFRRQFLALVEAAISRRDPRLLDAALDLATPPLGLLSLMVAGGGLVSAIAVMTHVAPAWAIVPWVVAATAIPGFVLVGLWSAGAPGSTWGVVLKAPQFLGWKVAAYARLVRGYDVRRWDRTDRVIP